MLLDVSAYLIPLYVLIGSFVWLFEAR